MCLKTMKFISSLILNLCNHRVIMYCKRVIMHGCRRGGSEGAESSPNNLHDPQPTGTQSAPQYFSQWCTRAMYYTAIHFWHLSIYLPCIWTFLHKEGIQYYIDPFSVTQNKQYLGFVLRCAQQNSRNQWDTLLHMIRCWSKTHYILFPAWEKRYMSSHVHRMSIKQLSCIM